MVVDRAVFRAFAQSVYCKVDCLLQEKNKIRTRVAKLERKVSELKEALKLQKKNKEKRLKRR